MLKITIQTAIELNFIVNKSSSTLWGVIFHSYPHTHTHIQHTRWYCLRRKSYSVFKMQKFIWEFVHLLHNNMISLAVFFSMFSAMCATKWILKTIFKVSLNECGYFSWTKKRTCRFPLKKFYILWGDFWDMGFVIITLKN